MAWVGVVRRYREEYLAAGVPVATSSTGRNSYCVACAMAELNTPDETTASETTAPDETGSGDAPSSTDEAAADGLAGRSRSRNRDR